MHPLIKILGYSIEGDYVVVRCTEVDATGQRHADFNVSVMAYDADNNPLDGASIYESVVKKLTARRRYALGRGAPQLKFPEFIELDAAPGA